MPDEEPIPSPPPPNAGPEPSPNPTSTGLPSNVAAALACIPLIGGIIFYVLEKRDSFVRFYAMQSIIFGGVWILCSIVYQIVWHLFSSIPGIGGFFGFILGLAWALISVGFLVV